MQSARVTNLLRSITSYSVDKNNENNVKTLKSIPNRNLSTF